MKNIVFGAFCRVWNALSIFAFTTFVFSAITATAKDTGPINAVPHLDNPVLSFTAPGWNSGSYFDAARVSNPVIVKDAGTYWMFYLGAPHNRHFTKMSFY